MLIMIEARESLIWFWLNCFLCDSMFTQCRWHTTCWVIRWKINGFVTYIRIWSCSYIGSRVELNKLASTVNFESAMNEEVHHTRVKIRDAECALPSSINYLFHVKCYSLLLHCCRYYHQITYMCLSSLIFWAEERGEKMLLHPIIKSDWWLIVFQTHSYLLFDLAQIESTPWLRSIDRYIAMSKKLIHNDRCEDLWTI